MKNKINPRELILHFRYDSNTGSLYWKKSKCNFKKDGYECNTTDTKGRKRVYIEGRTYAVSHVVFAMHFNRWPKNQLDHINRNKTDNRIENLREATNQENCCNKDIHKNNSSGFKGVSFHIRDNVYHSRIMHKGVMHHLGEYTSKIEAALAYNFAAKFYHGDFARLNNINLCGECIV